ncbi:MAG: BON domain-containing protein [Bdellovibrio sp.]
MPHRNKNRQEFTSNRNENRPYRSNHIDERRDWYERDMMDERSGYRADSPSQRERNYDTDRSLRGNTYESERWGAGANDRESSRDYSTNYSRDYNRDMPSDYTSTPQRASSSSYAGKGPKNFKRSDERIQEEVCEMLTRHHDINADDVEVEVKDGEVTLFGTVSERRMKHMAEDVAERCFGVKDVVNNIRIKRENERDFLSSEDTSHSRSERTGQSERKGSSSNVQNPSH